MAKLTLRIEFDEERAFGPGKARLLELIQQHRSISAAGRAMDMSYRRAWLLVDDLNRCFREPVVQAQHGGKDGGGAALTEFGKSLVEHYRAIEDEAERAARKRLAALCRKLRGVRPGVKT